MKKKLFVTAFILVISLNIGSLSAQYIGTVTIGNGTVNSTSSPISANYKNSYSQIIITADELEHHAGKICNISFNVTSSSFSAITNIYMGHTLKSTFTSSNNWETPASLSHVVIERNYTFTAGWKVFNLDIPFQYDGTSNLIIAVEHHCDETNSVLAFKSTAQSFNNTIYYRSDASPFNHFTPQNGTPSASRANVIIGFDMCETSIVSMTSETVTNCNYLYCDPGGPLSNYPNNLNIVQTLRSINNNIFVIDFLEFSLGSGDTLFVYDGPSAMSPMIGRYTGSNSPGQLTSLSEFMTFKFVSNNTDNGSGWLAKIGCAACPNWISTANGTPCNPETLSLFCTQIEVRPMGSQGDASSFFNTTGQVACLGSINHPTQFYAMRIDVSGNLIINIAQRDAGGTPRDGDFACWGPFDATSPSDFTYNLCCGYYTLDLYNNEALNNTNPSSTYPLGNLVDCSYDPRYDETCHILNAQSGQYFLLMLMNYNNGTSNTITFEVSSSSTASTDCSILFPQISSNSPVCEGDDIHLYIEDDNATAGVYFEWHGPNNFYSDQHYPVIYNADTRYTGRYTCTLHMGGDTASASTNFEVILKPKIEFNPLDFSYCPHESVTITVKEQLDSSHCYYLWQGYGIQYDTSAQGLVVPDRLLCDTSFMVSLTLTNSKLGCTSTDSIRVRYLDNTIPFFSSFIVPQLVDIDGERFLVPDLRDKVKKLALDSCFLTESLIATQIPVPGTEILQEQDVVVTVKDSCNNSASMSIHLYVPNSGIFIPNAFSPSSETNNIFKPVFLYILPEDYSMDIYDRWDNLIFSTTDINQGWDGTINNNKSTNLASYVYIINYKEKTSLKNKKRQGTVTLIP